MRRLSREYTASSCNVAGTAARDLDEPCVVKDAEDVGVTEESGLSIDPADTVDRDDHLR